MDFKHGSLLLILFLFSLAPLDAHGKDHDLKLQVGQYRLISTDPYTPLKLSKRGLLDIEEKAPGQWMITALRRGFVIIKQIKNDTTIHRWNVMISNPKRDGGVKEKDVIPSKVHFRAAAIVTTTEDGSNYQSLRGILNSKLTGTFQELFQRLYQWSRDSKSHWEMVAEPRVTLIQGKTAVAKTGVEIPIWNDSERNEGSANITHWKHLGAHFQAQLHSSTRGTHHLSYEIDLKSPQVDSRRGILSHHLSGSASLKSDSLQLVSKLRLSSINRQNHRGTILEAIPIIGPLFQQSQKSFAISELWLIAMATLSVD